MDTGVVIAALDLVLIYGTITVFDSDLEEPFNDVTAAHSAQGFSWRPGSVSFFKHGFCDTVAVQVRVAELLIPGADAARAIRVPFAVPASGRIEISNLVSGSVIELAPGAYALLYETGRLPRTAADVHWWTRCWYRLTFAASADTSPAILVADDELQPGSVLLMDAEPAQA